MKSIEHELYYIFNVQHNMLGIWYLFICTETQLFTGEAYVTSFQLCVFAQNKMCDSPPGGFLTLVEGRGASLVVANGFWGVYSFVAFLDSSCSSSSSTANGDLAPFLPTYTYMYIKSCRYIN